MRDVDAIEGDELFGDTRDFFGGAPSSRDVLESRGHADRTFLDPKIRALVDFLVERVKETRNIPLKPQAKR